MSVWSVQCLLMVKRLWRHVVWFGNESIQELGERDLMSRDAEGGSSWDGDVWFGSRWVDDFSTRRFGKISCQSRGGDLG